MIERKNMFMKRMIKSFVPLLLATSLPAWGAAPDQPAATNTAGAAKPTVKPSSLFDKTVVAKGKGVEVTRSQVDDEMIRFKAQAAAHGQNVPPEQAAMMERQILEQLIQVQ